MAGEDQYGYGDRAGEFLRIPRGQYHAGLHVGLGFILVTLAFWAPLCYGTLAILEARVPFLRADSYEYGQTVEEVGTVAAAVGLLIAVGIFWDRWRCIEATASRYCSGVMNASILYVPVVAAGYALFRGAQKLSGR